MPAGNEFCLCGQPAGQQPPRCAQCGRALCLSCAANRDTSGRGPECQPRPGADIPAARTPRPGAKPIR